MLGGRGNVGTTPAALMLANPGLREPVLASRHVWTIWSTTLGAVTVSVILLLAAPAPDLVYKAF